MSEHSVTLHTPREAPTILRCLPRKLRENVQAGALRFVVAGRGENADRRSKLRTKVDAWNEANKIGTPIDYRKDDDSILRTVTRTRAEVLGGHTAVIWLEGVTGCVDLDRVKPVQKKKWRAERIERAARAFIDDLRARHLPLCLGARDR